MEVNSFDLIGFDLFGVDLNSIDTNTDNSVSVKDDYIPTTIKPYIKGHITDGSSTFTFKINGNDITVPVDSNGNFKYKPTSTITSLSFVGIPQLEKIVLSNIEGLTTLNVEFPTEVVFKKCDSITQNSLTYIYIVAITDGFDTYLTDNNNNVIIE